MQQSSTSFDYHVTNDLNENNGYSSGRVTSNKTPRNKNKHGSLTGTCGVKQNLNGPVTRAATADLSVEQESLAGKRVLWKTVLERSGKPDKTVEPHE